MKEKQEDGVGLLWCAKEVVTTEKSASKSQILFILVECAVKIAQPFRKKYAYVNHLVYVLLNREPKKKNLSVCTHGIFLICMDMELYMSTGLLVVFSRLLHHVQEKWWSQERQCCKPQQLPDTLKINKSQCFFREPLNFHTLQVLHSFRSILKMAQ